MVTHGLSFLRKNNIFKFYNKEIFLNSFNFIKTNFTYVNKYASINGHLLFHFIKTSGNLFKKETFKRTFVPHKVISLNSWYLNLKRSTELLSTDVTFLKEFFSFYKNLNYNSNLDFS